MRGFIQEKVLKYEEYCKQSEGLVAWIKRVMIQLESRTFPTTIRGMKVGSGWRLFLVKVEKK